jgi:hypothetical protein
MFFIPSKQTERPAWTVGVALFASPTVRPPRSTVRLGIGIALGLVTVIWLLAVLGMGQKTAMYANATAKH